MPEWHSKHAKDLIWQEMALSAGSFGRNDGIARLRVENKPRQASTSLNPCPNAESTREAAPNLFNLQTTSRQCSRGEGCRPNSRREKIIKGAIFSSSCLLTSLQLLDPKSPPKLTAQHYQHPSNAMHYSTIFSLLSALLASFTQCVGDNGACKPSCFC